jgi:hypothetical protein
VVSILSAYTLSVNTLSAYILSGYASSVYVLSVYILSVYVLSVYNRINLRVGKKVFDNKVRFWLMVLGSTH